MLVRAFWFCVVFLPPIAWFSYRVVRAFRRGAFQSFENYDRASQPFQFKGAVATNSFMAAMFVWLAISVLIGATGRARFWVGAIMFSVFVAFMIGLFVAAARAGIKARAGKTG
jgi:hypothetical protein